MKRLSLTAWIFIAMLVGVALGAAFPNIGKAEWMSALANVFLRLIKSIIAPLIFGTLVYGIAGTGSVKTMGRIGIKAIVYFEVLTTIALVLGLGAVNLVRPGAGMTLERTAAETGLSQAGPTLTGTLEHTFPASVIDAMAKGDVLQIVVFSFLFGAACAAIGSKAAPVVTFCKSLSEVMFRYTKYVMYLAPIGVGAAMASTIGSKGLGVLLGLGKLILTLVRNARSSSSSWCWARWRSSREFQCALSSAPLASRSFSHFRRPRAKPRCPWRSKTWN